MFDVESLPGAVEITHRRWVGTRYNSHRQAVGAEYRDEQVMAGTDNVVSVESDEAGSVSRTTSRGTLYLPAGRAVDSRDSFVIGEVTYRVVEAPPFSAPHLFTGASWPTEVVVERVTG